MLSVTVIRINMAYCPDLVKEDTTCCLCVLIGAYSRRYITQTLSISPGYIEVFYTDSPFTFRDGRVHKTVAIRRC